MTKKIVGGLEVDIPEAASPAPDGGTDTPIHEQPNAGGSYLRQPDGSLQRQEA